jgi:hypothetical protein
MFSFASKIYLDPGRLKTAVDSLHKLSTNSRRASDVMGQIDQRQKELDAAKAANEEARTNLTTLIEEVKRLLTELGVPPVTTGGGIVQRGGADPKLNISNLLLNNYTRATEFSKNGNNLKYSSGADKKNITNGTSKSQFINLFNSFRTSNFIINYADYIVNKYKPSAAAAADDAPTAVQLGIHHYLKESLDMFPNAATTIQSPGAEIAIGGDTIIVRLNNAANAVIDQGAAAGAAAADNSVKAARNARAAAAADNSHAQLIVNAVHADAAIVDDTRGEIKNGVAAGAADLDDVKKLNDAIRASVFAIDIGVVSSVVAAGAAVAAGNADAAIGPNGVVAVGAAAVVPPNHSRKRLTAFLFEKLRQFDDVAVAVADDDIKDKDVGKALNALKYFIPILPAAAAGDAIDDAANKNAINSTITYLNKIALASAGDPTALPAAAAPAAAAAVAAPAAAAVAAPAAVNDLQKPSPFNFQVISAARLLFAVRKVYSEAKPDAAPIGNLINPFDYNDFKDDANNDDKPHLRLASRLSLVLDNTHLQNIIKVILFNGAGEGVGANANDKRDAIKTKKVLEELIAAARIVVLSAVKEFPDIPAPAHATGLIDPAALPENFDTVLNVNAKENSYTNIFKSILHYEYEDNVADATKDTHSLKYNIEIEKLPVAPAVSFGKINILISNDPQYTKIFKPIFINLVQFIKEYQSKPLNAATNFPNSNIKNIKNTNVIDLISNENLYKLIIALQKLDITNKELFEASKAAYTIFDRESFPKHIVEEIRSYTKDNEEYKKDITGGDVPEVSQQAGLFDLIYYYGKDSKLSVLIGGLGKPKFVFNEKGKAKQVLDNKFLKGKKPFEITEELKPLFVAFFKKLYEIKKGSGGSNIGSNIGVNLDTLLEKARLLKQLAEAKNLAKEKEKTKISLNSNASSSVNAKAAASNAKLDAEKAVNDLKEKIKTSFSLTDVSKIDNTIKTSLEVQITKEDSDVKTVIENIKPTNVLTEVTTILSNTDDLKTPEQFVRNTATITQKITKLQELITKLTPLADSKKKIKEIEDALSAVTVETFVGGARRKLFVRTHKMSGMRRHMTRKMRRY